MLCCCFTLVVFIKLNFTVALLLIKKTWMAKSASKMGGWGILRNGGGDPINGGMILKWEFDTSLRTMRIYNTICNSSFRCCIEVSVRVSNEARNRLPQENE